MFQSLKSVILTTAFFLFPLFFLPITQEYFVTNKFYLLVLACSLLLLLTALEIILSNKLSLKLTKLDLLKIFFLAAVLLSTIISSPNKIQALLNPNFGFVALLSLTILTFYIDRTSIVVSKILSFSTLILSVITIVFFFHPFRGSQFPFELQFLKNRFFTPLGTQTDLAIFLGFMIVIQSIQLLIILSSHKKNFLIAIPYTLYPIFTLSAFSLAVYSLLSGGKDQMMPFTYSWYSFAETLKNPMTAIFGVGIDNIASVFTRIKDIPYNLSNLWEIRSFDLGRTSLLHIATESGLLGLSAIILILIWAYKNTFFNTLRVRESTSTLPEGESQAISDRIRSNNYISDRQKLLLIPLLYNTVILLFFPPSLTVFFLFFLVLTINNQQSFDGVYTERSRSTQDKSTIPTSSSKLLYFPLAIVSIVLTIASFFFLSRSYLAEFFFKQSIDALANKKGKALYENQREAVQANPFIERFHINFSQTNLLLADTLRGKKSEIRNPKSETNPNSQNSNDQNGLENSNLENSKIVSSFDIRASNLIKEAAKIALIEANNTVVLNPQKASNWENLALISRNLKDVFEDAQKQTIEAYEKAILLDPQNPIYRLNLGSIYYLEQDFDQAVRLFEQTASLKKNWPNGHYNLSWALFQKQEYQKAIIEMQVAISLLDPEKDKADREKAQKDLEMMRNKVKPRTVPTDVGSGSEAKPGETPTENEIPSSSLERQTFLRERQTFPAPYVSTSEPQLDFSEIASPEAN